MTQKIYLWIIILFSGSCSAMERPPFRPPTIGTPEPQRVQRTTEIQSGRAQAEQRLAVELERPNSPFHEFVTTLMAAHPDARHWTDVIPLIDRTQRPQPNSDSPHASLYDFDHIRHPYGWGYTESGAPFIAVAYNYYENGIMTAEHTRRIVIQTFALTSPGTWEVLEWGLSSLATFTTFNPQNQLSFKAVATLISDYFIKIDRGTPSRFYSVHLVSRSTISSVISSSHSSLYQAAFRELPDKPPCTVIEQPHKSPKRTGTVNTLRQRVERRLQEELVLGNSPFRQFVNQLVRGQPSKQNWKHFIAGPVDISGRANARAYWVLQRSETFYITYFDFLGNNSPILWGYDESGSPFITIAYQYFESGIINPEFCYLHYPYKYASGIGDFLGATANLRIVIQTLVLRSPGNWQVYNYGYVAVANFKEFKPDDPLTFNQIALLCTDNFIKIRRGHRKEPLLVRLVPMSAIKAFLTIFQGNSR